MRVGFFYDYDYTLTEEFQQNPIFKEYFPELQKKYGLKNPEDYWKLCSGKDKGAAWMGQFLKDSKTIFHGLTNKKMHDYFAKKIELAPGLPEWFEKIEKHGKFFGIEIENHLISAGVLPLITGSPVAPFFKTITSGEFLDKGNEIYKIDSIVESFRKVEYLKKICKGGDLHRDLEIGDYHINYRNLIVFGDGQSDKDLFKYAKQRGGTVVAVYKKGDKKSFDKCVSSLGAPDYAHSFVNAIKSRDYNENSSLEKKVIQILQTISESEKNCDMDWELVNNWKLNHIKNKKICEDIEAHFNSCKYCQKKTELDFSFD